jgi:UDP-N-acetylglucosamine--N-acetylmuramyl-(pentapeptide) pyrophosphoryl-undecaprenol N-acetylglucosamine transferase
MRVIISGGGTGGHVFPAIAIADALKEIDKSIEILFVGAKGKLEMEKVPAAGYPIKGLWISGFQRRLTFKNLLFPVKLVHSLVRAYGILVGFKPDVAVGVGGYASGPLLKVANWRKVPTVLQEQNSHAGATNRLLAQKASSVCVAYPGMEKYFEKSKIILTGNPVRKEIYTKVIKTSEGNQDKGQNKKTVLIVGGSLGARSLNEAISHSEAVWNENPHIQLVWQVGKLYLDDYKNGNVALMPNVNVVAFIEDMAKVYAEADLIVCRAGALTISELALVGKPAILIPSPNVAEDHQTKNAMALVEKNAAWMIKDAEVKEKLGAMVIEKLSDAEGIVKVKQNLKQFAMPDAARMIAEEIIKVAKTKV